MTDDSINEIAAPLPDCDFCHRVQTRPGRIVLLVEPVRNQVKTALTLKLHKCMRDDCEIEILRVFPKSPDAARPLGASGNFFVVQHEGGARPADAPPPGDTDQWREALGRLWYFQDECEGMVITARFAEVLTRCASLLRKKIIIERGNGTEYYVRKLEI